jgi:hypothetical protein
VERYKGNNEAFFGGIKMKEIQDYVNSMFKGIPDTERSKSIKQEIIINLEEKVQDLVEQGKEREDAINKAIIDFGDIDEIKRELVENKKKNNSGIYLGYSIWGSLLIIPVVIFTNLYFTPKVIWFIYPVFLVLWWPLTMFYVWLNRKKQDR